MKYCQSCAMPLTKDEEHGTNADGTMNPEYCIYCYKQGSFTDPDLSCEAFIAKVEKIMKGMSLPDELIAQTKVVIPTLKRWESNH